MQRIRWNYDVLEHFRQNLVGRFGEVTCLTMILAGEHDPVAMASAARRLAGTLPPSPT
jgi:hypothetical protein